MGRDYNHGDRRRQAAGTRLGRHVRQGSPVRGGSIDRKTYRRSQAVRIPHSRSLSSLRFAAVAALVLIALCARAQELGGAEKIIERLEKDGGCVALQS